MISPTRFFSVASLWVAVYLGALSFASKPANAGYVSTRAVLTGYDVNGVVQGTVKIIMRSVNSDTNGLWTVDYTNAGLSNVLSCIPEAQGASMTAAGAVTANFVSATTTTCSGTVTKPSIVVLGFLSIALGNTVTPITVTVLGQ